jgi:hypothetical protein
MVLRRPARGKTEGAGWSIERTYWRTVLVEEPSPSTPVGLTVGRLRPALFLVPARREAHPPRDPETCNPNPAPS